MNSPNNIWSDLPLSAGIATFVCYAGVFNDVIGVGEVAARLGLSSAQPEFHTALNQLCLEGRLVLKDGFVALPDLGEKAALKAGKIIASQELINSRLGRLKKIGRNPLIKFVGVSGSLAAGNPTGDRNNNVDVDVFVITRNQCLWLYNIGRGLKNNFHYWLQSLFPVKKRELRLCMNYIMDESDSLVANRNFYTATEIINLIPVSGLEAHRRFIQVNCWVDYYYPGTSAGGPAPVSASTFGINKFFYGVYNVIRSVRWCLKTDPLKELFSYRGIHVNVQSPPCGGYQAMVQKKFAGLATKWFPDLLDADLIRKLFPDQLSEEIRSGELDISKIADHLGLKYNYEKYG